MKYKKPYKRHHRRRSEKKDCNWGAPKHIQREKRTDDDKKDKKSLYLSGSHLFASCCMTSIGKGNLSC